MLIFAKSVANYYENTNLEVNPISFVNTLKDKNCESDLYVVTT